jgi:hypothetical protein
MIAEIFKALVVEGALWTYRLIRKHPITTALLILLFIILPFLAEQYAKAAAVFGLVRRVALFFRGYDKDGNELGTSTKIFRYVLLIIVWVLIPGSSFLLSLFALSHWIGRERTINAEASRPRVIEPSSL